MSIETDKSVAPGVTFPLRDGRRSSTATGRAILADAARPVAPELAERIQAAHDWRRDYLDCVRDLVVASFPSGDAAVRIARAGLDSVQANLGFSDADGTEAPLAERVRAVPPVLPSSVTVRGREPRVRELVVPYAGQRLRGDGLRRQLERWQELGIVEPSHAQAVRAVVDNPEWLDLDSHSFALLGAGAEMAPLQPLLDWGATVYAVDRPDRALWERVGAVARGGAGRLVAPAPHGSDLPEAGLDLLRDLPQARAWLTQAPGTVVLGNYVYADGGAFLRLAAAVDAVTAAVLDERPDAVTAMLATPTDVFAAPADAVAESQRRWARRGSRRLAQAPARALSAGRLFRPQYEATRPLGDRLHAGVADCLVPQQGPNYALAKALQRWRVTVTEAAGRTVSANVAPPARTRSVLRNRALAAAYAGAPRFGVEVFAPATASTLMAALLVHDLRAEQVPTSHPQETFMRGANPGGLWRIAYEPRSVLGLAVGLGLLRRRS